MAASQIESSAVPCNNSTSSSISPKTAASTTTAKNLTDDVAKHKEMSAVSTVKKNIPYAVNKEGKAYRSFKLVSVISKSAGGGEGDDVKAHTAVNRSKKEMSNSSHLGPLRAAQKIFDAWCRENEHTEIADTKFIIQETTRGKHSRLYTYFGRREKLDEPRKVFIKDAKDPILYLYRSRVRAFRDPALKKGKKKGSGPAVQKASASAQKLSNVSVSAKVSSKQSKSTSTTKKAKKKAATKK